MILYTKPFTTCIHRFHCPIFRKKWVAAGHWPLPARDDHLKSRACCNTAELSDFNEKSGPAGLPFLGHILSAIPQEIIQPSPIARKQMAYWKKNYSEVCVLVESKFKDTKAKDDTNTKCTFSPEKWTCRYFCFPPPFKLWTTPVLSLHTPWRDLFDFSEPFHRDSLS